MPRKSRRMLQTKFDPAPARHTEVLCAARNKGAVNVKYCGLYHCTLGIAEGGDSNSSRSGSMGRATLRFTAPVVRWKGWASWFHRLLAPQSPLGKVYVGWGSGGSTFGGDLEPLESRELENRTQWNKRATCRRHVLASADATDAGGAASIGWLDPKER